MLLHLLSTCPICAQIETREKENSKLTLLKYVWLLQCCFLLHKTIASSDVDNVAMPNAMSNNHFEEILSVLYLSDNINLDEQFIMTKIRSFYDMIGNCCIENWRSSLDLSVDQSMVSYYGRKIANSKCKIILFDRDIRCGSLLGLLDMYSTLTHKKVQRMECQREQVKRLEVLRRLCYRVFMDNFFTSFRLFRILAINNIRASGAMRENRLGNCTISKKKAVDKF